MILNTFVLIYRLKFPYLPNLMKSKRSSLLFLYSLLIAFSASGQSKYAFSNKIANIQVIYNHHFVSGDIAKTFGNFNSVGTGGLLKTKTNWIISCELNYLFGSEIKNQHMLDNLVNGGGYIAAASGAPGNYSVNMRGYEAFVNGGRVFGLNKFNMNSGIFVQVGAGFLQHRINFQTQENNIPQLDANYRKGYDRLTYGVALNEFVGYYLQSKNRLINFYVGVDLVQAYTHNVREFNYDTRQYDKDLKHDYLTSIRFGWMIPIYLNTKDENEFQFK